MPARPHPALDLLFLAIAVALGLGWCGVGHPMSDLLYVDSELVPYLVVPMLGLMVAGIGGAVAAWRRLYGGWLLLRALPWAAMGWVLAFEPAADIAGWHSAELATGPLGLEVGTIVLLVLVAAAAHRPGLADRVRRSGWTWSLVQRVRSSAAGQGAARRSDVVWIATIFGLLVPPALGWLVLWGVNEGELEYETIMALVALPLIGLAWWVGFIAMWTGRRFGWLVGQWAVITTALAALLASAMLLVDGDIDLAWKLAAIGLLLPLFFLRALWHAKTRRWCGRS